MTNNFGMIVNSVISMLVLVLVLVVVAVGARTIEECNGRPEGYIDNTRENCNYKKIYCSDINSVYCDDIDLCDEDYECVSVPTAIPTGTPTATATTSVSSSSSTLSTLSTSQQTQSTVQDVRRICVQGVTRRFAYPHNCNYFYYCVDGFLLVEQCPLGYAFNERTAQCSGRISDVPDCVLR